MDEIYSQALMKLIIYCILIFIPLLIGFSFGAKILNQEISPDCLITQLQEKQLAGLTFGFFQNDICYSEGRWLYDFKYPKSKSMGASAMRHFLAGCLN